jgi:hypothetical protein
MRNDVPAPDRLVGRVCFHCPQLDPGDVAGVSVETGEVWTDRTVYRLEAGATFR